MKRLISFELVKLFFKKRTYIGFVIVLLIVPLVEIAMKLEGGKFLSRALRGLEDDFLLIGNLFNGWFVAHQLMNSLWFHIPLLISFVAGDQLAGEATAGTYRLILIRPVSRTRIFIAKYIAVLVYIAVFILFLAVLSIVLALVLLGHGDLMVLSQGILLLPDSEVLWRFVLAYLLAAWTMTTIASLSFFFSAFVENAIGPIVATMGVLIFCTIIQVLPVESLDPLRDILFTKHIDLWRKGFQNPIPWREILSGILFLGAWIVSFLFAAWTIFTRKDILS